MYRLLPASVVSTKTRKRLQVLAPVRERLLERALDRRSGTLPRATSSSRPAASPVSTHDERAAERGQDDRSGLARGRASRPCAAAGPSRTCAGRRGCRRCVATTMANSAKGRASASGAAPRERACGRQRRKHDESEQRRPGRRKQAGVVRAVHGPRDSRRQRPDREAGKLRARRDRFAVATTARMRGRQRSRPPPTRGAGRMERTDRRRGPGAPRTRARAS